MYRVFTRTITAALFLSVLLHVSFWGGLEMIEFRRPQTSVDHPIEIEVLDEEDQRRLEQLEKDKPLRQIVEQDKKPLNDEVPEKTRFLSRFDQRVEKETRASKTGQFTNADQQGAQNKGREAPSKKPKKQAAKNGTLPSLKDLTPSFSTTPKDDKSQPVEPVGLASQTNDHLPDVQEGLQTLLNTREFVYYSYYQRIRDKIRQYWEPKIREKVRKIFASGRSIASSSNKITKVIIVLDRRGSLLKVQVIGESGIHDLDEAAIEAFRAAEPFPNPPDGIIEQDGTIKIRWDFVLEASYQWLKINKTRFLT